MMRALSLGAGVQSSTLLLMACAGQTDPLNHAIFADTGWEPRAVYRWINTTLRPAAERAGIGFHVVSAGNIRVDALSRHRHASIPLFVRNPDGSRGRLFRQCTAEYKVRPVQRRLRELLGYRPGQHIPPGALEQWLGISLDESQRMRDARVRWICHRYPLIEQQMNRADCVRWLAEHGYPPAPRSACIGCPFRSNTSWARMRRDRPKEFADACSFDRAIRRMPSLRGRAYVHRSLVPLSRVSFQSPGAELFGEECEGMCRT